MSCYTLAGKEPRYRLRVGVETALPFPSLFGQVLDLGWQTDGAVLDEQEARLGETPHEQSLVRVGGSAPPLWEMETLVSALAPYGQIPLTMQLQLLGELDALVLFPLFTLGKRLVTICQQDASARLKVEPSMPENPLVVLTAQGWQMRSWQTVARNPRQQISQVLFPGQHAPLHGSNAFEDALSVVLWMHEDGIGCALPVCALLAHGAALLGPVGVAQHANGLTARQLQVVQQELVFVPAALQAQVNVLWFRAWASIVRRGC